jgi:hypothetical protein
MDGKSEAIGRRDSVKRAELEEPIWETSLRRETDEQNS